MPPRIPNTDCTKIGPLDQTALGEMRQIVEMADVVALELEARAVVAATTQNGLDILEGVLKYEITALFEVFALPFVLELLEPVQHRKQAEIHRTHVQRRHFGLESQRPGACALRPSCAGCRRSSG